MSHSTQNRSFGHVPQANLLAWLWACDCRTVHTNKCFNSICCLRMQCKVFFNKQKTIKMRTAWNRCKAKPEWQDEDMEWRNETQGQREWREMIPAWSCHCCWRHQTAARHADDQQSTTRQSPGENLSAELTAWTWLHTWQPPTPSHRSQPATHKPSINVTHNWDAVVHTI